MNTEQGNGAAQDSAKSESVETIGRLEIHRHYYADLKPWVLIYNARSKGGRYGRKALFNYTFRSQYAAEAFISEKVNNEAAWEQLKADRKRHRSEYAHDYQVGDIIEASWGWEQTNVDFYEVVAVPSPHSVTLREIGAAVGHQDPDGPMSCYVVAVPHSFKGEPFIKRVSVGGGIRFESYKYGHKWDGREQYCSWYA